MPPVLCISQHFNFEVVIYFFCRFEVFNVAIMSLLSKVEMECSSSFPSEIPSSRCSSEGVEGAQVPLHCRYLMCLSRTPPAWRHLPPTNSDCHCTDRCQHFLSELGGTQDSLISTCALQKELSIYLGIMGSLNCENNLAACPLPSGLATVGPHPATRVLELLFTLQLAEALVIWLVSSWVCLKLSRSPISWAKMGVCCVLSIFDVLVATSLRFKNKQNLSAGSLSFV